MQKFPLADRAADRPSRLSRSQPAEVWENTLSAFARAADAGFAIECDLQYAADAVPVVFHDDDLKRLCGIEGTCASAPPPNSAC